MIFLFWLDEEYFLALGKIQFYSPYTYAGNKCMIILVTISNLSLNSILYILFKSIYS